MRAASGARKAGTRKAGSMAEVIELDNTTDMTADQALARAGREGFKNCIIIGDLEDGTYSYVFSKTTNADAYWTLHKIASMILAGHFDE